MARQKRRGQRKPKEHLIYLVTCRKPGEHFGKKYVGQTSDFQRRCSDYLHGRGHGRIGRAIREMGAQHFDITPLERVNSFMLDAAEMYWIREHNSMHPHGFNSKKGGQRKNQWEA